MAETLTLKDVDDLIQQIFGGCEGELPDDVVKLKAAITLARAHLEAREGGAGELRWRSSREELPPVAEPVLWKSGDKIRMKCLFIRHEGVSPTPSDTAKPHMTDWYWDAPRGNDMSLARSEVEWMPLTALDAADALTAKDAQLSALKADNERLREALEPFDKAARVMFQHNWNDSDVVFDKLVFKDFRRVVNTRAALGKDK